MKEKYPYKYKVLEKKSDDLDTLIEQSGIKATLTIKGAMDNVKRLKSYRKEMEAQIKLEKAKMQNIVDNAHAEMSSKRLDEMNDRDLQTAYIYVNSFIICKTADEKLKQIEEALEKIAEDMEQITQQTGLKCPEIKDDGKQIA